MAPLQPSACSLALQLSSQLCPRGRRGEQNWCSVAYSSTAPKDPLRFRSASTLYMGQRLSSTDTMATNVEKTAGEEKTFVCAVSTGS